MSYPKGSIHRLTPAWKDWLETFNRRYPLEVSRMRGESLEQRALAVLRFRIPGWD